MVHMVRGVKLRGKHLASNCHFVVPRLGHVMSAIVTCMYGPCTLTREG